MIFPHPFRLGSSTFRRNVCTLLCVFVHVSCSLFLLFFLSLPLFPTRNLLLRFLTHSIAVSLVLINTQWDIYLMFSSSHSHSASLSYLSRTQTHARVSTRLVSKFSSHETLNTFFFSDEPSLVPNTTESLRVRQRGREIARWV